MSNATFCWLFSLFTFLFLGFVGGLIGVAFKTHADNNDYVRAECLLLQCNQTSSVCSGKLCSETVIVFSLTDLDGEVYTQSQLLGPIDSEAPCPPNDTVIPCYYRNEENIAETLNLNELGNPDRDLDIGLIILMLVGMAVSLCCLCGFSDLDLSRCPCYKETSPPDGGGMTSVRPAYDQTSLQQPTATGHVRLQ